MSTQTFTTRMPSEGPRLLQDFQPGDEAAFHPAMDELAKTYALDFLLAFCHDGVVWGRRVENSFIVSSDVFPKVSPKLRTETVQQVRLFGLRAEVTIWNDGDKLKAALLHEEDPQAQLKEMLYFTDQHLLWGTDVDGHTKNGFTIIYEGARGLHHAVPLPVTAKQLDKGKARVKLTMRHYVDYSSDDQAYVRYSRLVKLG